MLLDHGLDHGLSLIYSFLLLRDRNWTTLSFWSEVWRSQGFGVDVIRLRVVLTPRQAPPIELGKTPRGQLLAGCDVRSDHFSVGTCVAARQS